MKAILLLILICILLDMIGCWDMRRATSTLAPPAHLRSSGGHAAGSPAIKGGGP